MAYIDVGIVVSPDDLLQQVYDYLQARIPEWTPSAGQLDVWLAEAFSQIASQVNETGGDVPRGIFRTYGATLANVPPLDATAATGSTTWTLIDTAGHTIPAGTIVSFGTGESAVPFQTTADATVAPGSSQATGVSVTAVDAGAAGSGLTGAGTLQDELDFIDTVTLESATTGGQDAEDDATYLDRLAADLRLLTPRPILPADFAQLAQNIPGVERCLAVDGYNPSDGSTGNARMVAVFPIDSTGQPVSAAAQGAVQSSLADQREVTFVVNVASPTYTTVDVAFTATLWPGWDAATVQANAIAAVQSFLDPSKWGAPVTGDPRDWVNDTKVRYLEVAQVLQEVDGLHYVDTLTLGAQKAATVTAADDTVHATAHGYANGDTVIFRSLTGGAGLTTGTTYYVVGATADTFQVSATSGGAAIDVTSDATAGSVVSLKATDVTLAGTATLPLAGNVSGSVS